MNNWLYQEYFYCRPSSTQRSQQYLMPPFHGYGHWNSELEEFQAHENNIHNDALFYSNGKEVIRH